MSGNRKTMKPLRVWLLLGAAVAASACVPSEPKTVSLRMTGDTPDASVTIDGQYIGALGFVAKRGVAMPPGKHEILVEKPGYFPWDRIVEAREGDGPVKLDVRLQKIPD
jgi:hypothetical protein